MHTFEKEKSIIKNARDYIKKDHKAHKSEGGVDFQIRAVFKLLNDVSIQPTQRMQIIHTLMHNEVPFGPTTRKWATAFQKYLAQNPEDIEIINKNEHKLNEDTRRLLLDAIDKAGRELKEKAPQNTKPTSTPAQQAPVIKASSQQPKKPETAVKQPAESQAKKTATASDQPRPVKRPPAPTPGSPEYRAAEAAKTKKFEEEEKCVVMPKSPLLQSTLFKSRDETLLYNTIFDLQQAIKEYLDTRNISDRGTTRAKQLDYILQSSEATPGVKAVVIHAFLNENTGKGERDIKGTGLLTKLEKVFSTNPGYTKIVEKFAQQEAGKMGLFEVDLKNLENQILTNLTNGAYDAQDHKLTKDHQLTDAEILTFYDKKMSEAVLFTPVAPKTS